MMFGQTFLSGIYSLIFPANCLACRKGLDQDEEALCEACLGAMTHNVPPFCAKCSRRLKPSLAHHSLCDECQKIPYAFDRAWSATAYDEAMKQLIHFFKYQNKIALRHVFGEILKNFIETYRLPIATFDYLVPVPLHASKMREREYNQSFLLAQEIGKHYGIPVLQNQLIRCRATKTQALLSEKDRWTNVKDAFKIRQPHIFDKKSILVIDDLMTTGATVHEVASLLKRSGATSVYVLTLASA